MSCWVFFRRCSLCRGVANTAIHLCRLRLAVFFGEHTLRPGDGQRYPNLWPGYRAHKGDGSNVLSCCYDGCSGASAMNFTLECEQEVDGRWIAEVPELPGVLSYGSSAADAMSRAEILALRVIADRLEHGEAEPVSISLSLPVVA